MGIFEIEGICEAVIDYEDDYLNFAPWKEPGTQSDQELLGIAEMVQKAAGYIKEVVARQNRGTFGAGFPANFDPIAAIAMPESLLEPEPLPQLYKVKIRIEAEMIKG